MGRVPIKLRALWGLIAMPLVINGAVALTLPTIGNMTGCLVTSNVHNVTCPTGHHIFCDNLPGVIAGTGADANFNAYLTSRHPEQVGRDSDESDASTYCEPRTNVFVVVNHLIPKPAIRSLLESALRALQHAINIGDVGPIPYVGWRWLGPEATSLLVYSEDQFQTTYEVLLVAFQELQRWMQTGGRTWGTCTFTIWNGQNKVGRGGLMAAGQ